MIVMDGMSTPGFPFGYTLFIAFELFTLLVEFIVISIFNRAQEKEKRWTNVQCAEVTFVMNLASAFFAIPIWESLQIGGM